MTLIGCNRQKADPVEIINTFRKEGYAVQPVRSDMVFGAEHMMAAYMHAARAFARGSNRSDDLMTEFMMYAACETQITRAIEKMKVTSHTLGGRFALLTEEPILRNFLLLFNDGLLCLL